MRKTILSFRSIGLFFLSLALLGTKLMAVTTIPVGVGQTYSTIQAAYNSGIPADITGLGAYEIVLQSTYVPSSETYPITLGAKTGASAVNTITIKPGSNAKIILGPASATTVVTPITTTAGTTLTIPDASTISDGYYAYGVGVSDFQTVTKSGNVLTFSSAITAAAGTTLFFGPKDTKTIQFNGASYVIIDGVSRSNASQGLTIQNPNNIGAQTINFTGISTNNVVRNCIIKGASVSGNSAADAKCGVIYFDAQANNANTIENNDITKITGNYAPVTAVCLANTTSSASDYNTIQNNNIVDVFNTGLSPNGINAGIYFSGSANANVMNNKIYWTVDPSTNVIVDKDYVVIHQNNSNGAQSRIEGNLIGSATVSNLTTSGAFYGIYANSAATVKNDTIKNLTITVGKSASASKNMYGISVNDVANGLTDLLACSGNMIDNISVSTLYTGNSYNTYAISINQTASVTSKARSIDNNTVSNITGYNTATGQGATVRSIVTTTSSGTGTALWSFSGNKIFNITANNNTSNQGNIVFGFDIQANTGTVDKNLIYNLKTSSSSTSAYVVAIRLTGGNTTGTTIRNNVISLGSTTTANIIYGIWQNGATATSNILNVYHNSVYIGGSVSSGAVNTYAYYRTGTVPVADIRNNIFSNQRTGGTGKHYILSVAAATNIATCNKNIYQYATGSFGTVGTSTTASYPNMSDWQTSSSKDGGSLASNPLFISISLTSPDLHVTASSPALGAGDNLSVATDYDNQNRTTTPAIGAFELSSAPSITPVANATYWTGAVLDFKINYSSAATVTGAPRFAITLNTGGTVYANYLSGSGTTSLTFRYVVGSGQVDADGITLGSTVLLNGGTITVNGAAANLTIPSTVTTGIKIDDITTSASERRWLVYTAPADGIYTVGQNIDIKVSPVSSSNASGALVNFAYTSTKPYIPLTLDNGVVVNAVIVEVAGTITATQYKTFRYTVATNVVSASNITFGNIELNGSTINYNSGGTQYGQNVNFTGTPAVKIDGTFTAPTSAAASSVLSTGFTANWSAPVTAPSTTYTYTLEYGTASDFTAATAVTGITSDVLTSVITGLTANTTYYYRVKAVRTSNGATTVSGNQNVLTLPDVPTSGAANPVTATGFTANWTAPTQGAATFTYTLEYGTASDLAGATSSVGIASSNLLKAITGLTANTQYYYRVKAVNATGAGTASDIQSVLTLPGTTTTNNALGKTSTSITPAWSAPTGQGAASFTYTIEYGTDNTFAVFSTITGISGSSTSYLIDNMPSNTTHYFRVKAVNASGAGAMTAFKVATTYPAAPTVAAADNISSTGFTANWSAPTQGPVAFTYKLEYSTVADLTSGVTTVNNIASTNLSSAISSLTASTTYYYRVTAVNAVGSSAASAIQSVTTAGSTLVDTDKNATDLSLLPGTIVSVVNGGHLIIDQTTTVNSITVEAGGRLTNSSTLNATTLTLKNSTSGSGTYIDNGTTNVTTTNVQQNLDVIRNWYVSSPLTNATAPAGYTYFRYDEKGDNPHTPITSPETSYWESVVSGDALEKGRGYIAIPASIESPLTFTTSSGTLNTGNVTVSLTASGATKTGFNLVGNPYPSHITWTYAKAVASNVLNTIWYRTYNTNTSKYAFNTYQINEDGSYIDVPQGTSNIIPPMQAFWVRLASGATGELMFTNTMRSHQTSNPLKTQALKFSTQQLLRLQVSNGINNDEAVIYFNHNASNGYDSYDAPKMSNGSKVIPEIYTLAGTEQLVINGLNAIPYDAELPLGFTTGTSGTFSLKASQIASFDAGTQVILKDYIDVNNVVIADLSQGNAYNFSSDITSNNTSRFTLTFKAPSVATGINPSDITNAVNVSVYRNANNQIVVNYDGLFNSESVVSVYNALGQKLMTRQLKSTVTVLDKLPCSGAYMIQLSGSGKTVTKKLIID